MIYLYDYSITRKFVDKPFNENYIHQYTVSLCIGSVAAAVTGVVFNAVSFPPEFIVNHPFIVLIKEHTTGVILFMGRVCSPLTEDGMVDITSG